MTKVWLIAQHHFMKEARSRTFLLLLFALPLFLGFVTVFGYVFSVLQSDHTTLGYVDPAGWLANPEAGPPEPEVTLVRLDVEADARRALEAGEVDAYYLLPASHDARLAQLVYYEPPGYTAARYFQDLVRRNAMAGLSPVLVERVLDGADVTVRATATNREFPGGDPTSAHLLPLIAAAIFSFLVITTFGYLGEAVVTEKENRTMEVIVTCVSVERLMAGKIVGGLGIALLLSLIHI